MRIAAQYEKPHKKRLNKIFDRQHAEVLSSLSAITSDIKPDAIKDFPLFNDSEYDQTMVKSLTPVLHDLAGIQGGLAMSFAGDHDSTFILTAPFQQALAAGTQKMAQNVNDRTLEKLNASLAEGMRQGEGLSKLKNRVDDVYGNLKGYEANRIARTETLRASNSASIWAYKQTGYVVGKQWVVNPDACDICSEMDGVTIALDDSYLGMGDSLSYGDDQSFVADYSSVDEPPLHPNCRCTVVPTTTLGDSPNVLSDESGFIGGDEESLQTVFRGEGANVQSDYGLLFGDAYYVARDASQAANFGTVHQLSLGINAKDILILHTDKELETFHLAAQRWAVNNGKNLDPNSYIPAYILNQGYKAAEVLPSVDPLGGIGVVDKKVIAHLASQIEGQG